MAGCAAVRPRLAAPEPTITAAVSEPLVQAAPPNTVEPPAVAGKRLQTVDVETATEKALELSKKLTEAESERNRLAARVEALESSVKAKDQALELARGEIQVARTEMARARQDLEQWKLEISALRDRLRGADEENVQTLQTAVALLQQILAQPGVHEVSAAPQQKSTPKATEY
jgi:chromosome segregation ATPase